MAELLASVADLRTFLGDDELEQAEAELVLRLASGEVRAATGNLFDLKTADVVTLDGSGSRVLLLPDPPILAVSEVLELGVVLEPERYEWSEAGVLRRLDHRVFLDRLRGYVVTNDHGYAVTPDEVAAVVLRVAGRSLDNPEGMRSETLGRYSYTAAGEAAGVGLYAPDLADLVPYTIAEKRGRAGTAASTGSGSGS